MSLTLSSWKLFSQVSIHSNLAFFFVKAVSGAVMEEKPSKKGVVETIQSQKDTDIIGNKRIWPFINSLKLHGVHLYTLIGHNMTQEGH